jgi:hypothetical protein
MPTILETVRKLEQRRAALKVTLAEVGDLRPGSLVERYRRCGKAGCHCAGAGAEGHGPSWSLTREVGGKTVTRVIRPDAVPRTRAQIAEYRRFRAVVRELVETSEHLCDAKLAVPDAASQEGAEKGGSTRRSRRTSTPKSPRS